MGELAASFRRIFQALGLLLIPSVMGTIGYMAIEDYSLVDALYMTAITMSTVGYGTIGELSTEGKIFSIVLIGLSVSIFLYAISTITTFVVEGEMRHWLSRYQVSKKVAKLNNHYIICGLGRNGREAATELIRQNQPFVIVEVNEDIIEEFQSTHNYLFIKGDATHEEVLEQANIHQARGLISSLSTDAENVYITLTAREMNPHMKIVARASNESTISKLRRAGADHVIVPNLIGGRRMANVLTRPALMEFIDLVSGEGNPDLHLEEINCAEQQKLIGFTLAQLHIRSQTGVSVVGAKNKEGQVELNLQASRPLTSGDRLFIMGTDEQIDLFKEKYIQ